MSSIQEYIVVEPPTSGEVERRAGEALADSRVLELVIAAERDIPRPTNEAAAFLIKQAQFPDKGGICVSGTGLAGTTEENDSFIVRTNAGDPSQPAHISIVRA